MQENVRSGGDEVIVYAGISIDVRNDLFNIQNESLTSRRYRADILKPIVIP